MPFMSNVSATLDKLAEGYLSTVYNPAKHEGFSVREGDKTGKGGVVSGVLGPEDYAAFMDIVKDVNIRDASCEEMDSVYRRLKDANLVSEGQMISISGTLEFVGTSQVNGNLKYDQLEYQRKQLPLYTTPNTDSTRVGAINSFKVVAAIANASPLTGQTVAHYAICETDRNQAVQVDISDEARKKAREETYGIHEQECDPAKFMNGLIEQMREVAQAAKAAEDARVAQASIELPPATVSST